MTKLNFSLCFIGLLLCLIVCSNYAEGKTWCVAQSQASNSKLQQVLDNLCGHLNCKEILPGGPCFAPDTLRNHASYAIDLNYRINGICDTSYATPAITDPCKYLSCRLN
uniref:glucan endo-1,3-beta-glucosidase-like n=1 Tax=Erigeron canadensis TaxID=72917 RepID=UPI001CB8A734|nr:glucan endo-1,3-beta-glucosidase-like [Erigeron canadensis]